MYRLDWIERLKLNTATTPSGPQVARVSPVVWKLGFTSLLTDVSSEMVNSALPVYLVLYLRLSPAQYGAIDGVYNGVAVALLSLAGGLLADRTRRYKEVAAAGYVVSTICKLLLVFAGGAWGWLAAITAIDRTGKGGRTTPRDSLISLHSSRETLAAAFAVHRALDAGGALLGPIVAFALLYWLPDAFDAVWVTSFVFGFLGLSVLWLFVPNPTVTAKVSASPPSIRAACGLLRGRRFRTLALIGTILSIVTASDGFVYLILQQKAVLASGAFPLFYVVTTCFYMLLSIPVGRIADSWGRAPIFLVGYVALALMYLLLLLPDLGWIARTGCLLLFGLYYAATEGILMAMASAIIPAELRTSGLAILATLIGLAKMVSSLLFGWLWQSTGTEVAIAVFGAGLATAIMISGISLRSTANEAT